MSGDYEDYLQEIIKNQETIIQNQETQINYEEQNMENTYLIGLVTITYLIYMFIARCMK